MRAKVNDQFITDRFAAYNMDCVEGAKSTPDDSVHFIIYSPPFSSLYTYSASDRDMGNSKSDEEFMNHFQFLVRELYRVLKPGRLMAVHCMNLPTSKSRDGYIGIKDFRGDLIRAFQAEGFIYHSEVCIWKDPVIAQRRTKALGLLHKQLVKDSAMSRQGIPDYLVVMRKPGENDEPVAGTLNDYYGTDDEPDRKKWTREDDTRNWYSIEVWQKYASPVWMDINPSDTLQRESAREEKDEKHIAPLQLEVIRRALQLWTNKDDIVLSPFMGIGSEGYASLLMERRFVGYELKPSYYEQAVKNLQSAVEQTKVTTLFDLSEVAK
ncbi:methyltransferase [Alicyclobacillus acidoterrestris]|nr:methyltransferase [Alicyclobacillus acidoterrestris]